MGKMVFDDFDDYDVIDLPSPKGNKGKDIGLVEGIGAASALISAAVPVVTQAIACLDTIAGCVASVQNNKEETKRVQAQAQIEIQRAKETTRQVEVHEKELTNRAKLEYLAKVKQNKKELEELKQKLQVDREKLKESQREFDELLNLTKMSLTKFLENYDDSRTSLLVTQNPEEEARIRETMRGTESEIIQFLGKLVDAWASTQASK